MHDTTDISLPCYHTFIHCNNMNKVEDSPFQEQCTNDKVSLQDDPQEKCTNDKVSLPSNNLQDDPSEPFSIAPLNSNLQMHHNKITKTMGALHPTIGLQRDHPYPRETRLKPGFTYKLAKHITSQSLNNPIPRINHKGSPMEP